MEQLNHFWHSDSLVPVIEGAEKDNSCLNEHMLSCTGNTQALWRERRERGMFFWKNCESGFELRRVTWIDSLALVGISRGERDPWESDALTYSVATFTHTEKMRLKSDLFFFFCPYVTHVWLFHCSLSGPMPIFSLHKKKISDWCHSHKSSTHLAVFKASAVWKVTSHFVRLLRLWCEVCDDLYCGDLVRSSCTWQAGVTAIKVAPPLCPRSLVSVSLSLLFRQAWQRLNKLDSS